MTDAHIAADLDFAVSLPRTGTSDPRVVTCSLKGEHSKLRLWVDRPLALAGRVGRRRVHAVAETLARRGITLAVAGPDGPVATLGAVRPSWLHRRLTGSPYLRVGRLRAALHLARARGGPPAASLLEVLPPPTLWPLAPTFRSLRRGPVTTTHDSGHGGNPRLVLAPGPAPMPGDRPRVFPLLSDVTRVGSDQTADVRLSGLAPEHAEVRRNDDDEFVVVPVNRPEESRVNGAPADGQLLRTGSRVDFGMWTLSYSREEFADHGRPYGGRIGGEAGHQRRQPPRTRPVGYRGPSED